MEQIITLINGVGFPIAACIAMGWFIVWTRKQNDAYKKEVSDKNIEVINDIKEIVERNTTAIEKLIIKLDSDEKLLKELNSKLGGEENA